MQTLGLSHLILVMRILVKSQPLWGGYFIFDLQIKKLRFRKVSFSLKMTQLVNAGSMIPIQHYLNSKSLFLTSKDTGEFP